MVFDWLRGKPKEGYIALRGLESRTRGVNYRSVTDDTKRKELLNAGSEFYDDVLELQENLDGNPKGFMKYAVKEDLWGLTQDAAELAVKGVASADPRVARDTSRIVRRAVRTADMVSYELD